MRTIHKFVLNIGETVLSLPADAKPLYVDNQHGELCLWVELDPHDFNRVDRHFIVFGTGHLIGDIVGMEITYIGTTLLDSGYFVAHVYEGKMS